MKKLIFLPLAFCFLSLSAQMQHAAKIADTVNKSATVPADRPEGWKFDGTAGANFSQVSLTDWAAGGENSLAGNALFKASLSYLKNKWQWDNLLDLEYGMTYTESTDWRKNLDKILFATQLNYPVNEKFFYALLLDFQSQFADGYDYTTTPSSYLSTFMAPAYSNAALGISYKPNANYSFFLSPITLRTTIVLDDDLAAIGAYGVKDGKNFLFEPGLYFVARGSQKIMDNVTLTSKLDVFTPYDANFGNLDINWDVAINCQINKVLSANVAATLRYFERESYELQIKQMLGLGLSYNF